MNKEKNHSDHVRSLEEVKKANPKIRDTLYKEDTELAISSEKAEKIYDEISEVYDDFMQNNLGWKPENVLPLISKHVEKTGLLLDAGVGTGLIGVGLGERGYQNLWGIDISTKMLEEARKRGFYSRLEQADLYKPLPFEAHQFDGVFSVGVLIHIEHPLLLREFVRVTKPGGSIVIGCRQDRYEGFGYTKEAKKMVKENLWEVVHSDLVNYCVSVEEYVNQSELHYAENVYKVL